VNFCFPAPVALPFENPYSVARHGDLLTRVSHQLSGRLGDLVSVATVGADIDNFKLHVPASELDARFPELPNRFRAGDGRSALKQVVP